jgi:hypothetical protein
VGKVTPNFAIFRKIWRGISVLGEFMWVLRTCVYFVRRKRICGGGWWVGGIVK